jgi:hypothetical protein
VAETVYYCWSCDAHRRLKPSADGTGNCPRCRQTLAADCLLGGRATVKDGGVILPSAKKETGSLARQAAA